MVITEEEPLQVLINILSYNLPCFLLLRTKKRKRVKIMRTKKTKTTTKRSVLHLEYTHAFLVTKCK